MNGPEHRAEHSIEVFFDGDCPLCRREIAWLQRRDRAGRVRFTDIAASDFPGEGVDRSFDELMAELHVRDERGQWHRGVEAFRKLYAALGFAWLVRLSRLPLVAHGLALAYRIFARNRLRLTGRCAPLGCRLPQARHEIGRAAGCSEGATS